MSFLETPRFYENISYGSSGGPSFRTTIAESSSGTEERVSHWGQGRYKADAKYGIRTYDDLYNVLLFYRVVEGASIGFRWKDHIDYATTANGRTPSDGISTVDTTSTDVLFGTGDGTTTLFQLVKKYTKGVLTRTRSITKPVSGTVKISSNGVTITTGFTIDYTAGTILFTIAPLLGVLLKWGGEFDIPVRFGKEVDEDGLLASLSSFGDGEIPSIPVIEIRNGLQTLDEMFYGGALDIIFASDIVLSKGDGIYQELYPAAGGLVARLPLEDDLDLGGPHFYLTNGSANALTVSTYGGISVFTLPAAVGAVFGYGEVHLGTLSSVRTWRVYGA